MKLSSNLWNHLQKKETTLHYRLSSFFVFVSFFLIFIFVLLLLVFGITGKGENSVQNYMNRELLSISDTITEDFGLISVEGIRLAEEIIRTADNFFLQHKISANELSFYPDLLEPFLQEQIHLLLNTINNRPCGGVFLLLDATINPLAEQAETSKAGIFLKKTQPTSTQTVGVKLHYLRGPAEIARQNNITLIAQWKMEFDIEVEDFFNQVMKIAYENPSIPLSRLYYWSGRVMLKGNSEAGFLLCVPLRSSDGSVFGVCGIEVSDRMFKSLYSPKTISYENIFTVATPSSDTQLQTSFGLVAGNYYLTGNRFNENLTFSNTKNNFDYFTMNDMDYGGKVTSLRLYPNGSLYEDETWSVAILMPKNLLTEAIWGKFFLLIAIVVILLIIGFIISIFISHHYLRPVKAALNSIKDHSYKNEITPMKYLEINDLFEFLTEKDRLHEEALTEKDRLHEEILNKLHKKHEDIQVQYDMVQTYVTHLADERMPEVEIENFEYFMQCLHSLTAKEEEIFNLYLEGKRAKDIIEILEITQNTLKYHNKNIYSKLGVNSRKQLLEYAALMKYTKES